MERDKAMKKRIDKWKYHKLFSGGALPTTDAIWRKELYEKFSELRTLDAAKPAETLLPAAYTYLGQFVDHDLGRLRQLKSPPGESTIAVGDLIQEVNPSLNLSSLYGHGLGDVRIAFEKGAGVKGTGKFDLDRRNVPEAVNRYDYFMRRGDDGKARIADQRNDENLFVSRLHVLFMLLHNGIADFIRKERKVTNTGKLFSLAQAEVTLIYQHLVLHDFAKRILPNVVYKQVIEGRKVLLSKSTRYAPSLPVEFAAAAFRLHAWVRGEYLVILPVDRQEPKNFVPIAAFLNRRNDSIFTDVDTVDAKVPPATDQPIDWRLFLETRRESDQQEVIVNRAMSLTPVAQVFGHVDMPMRSIQRGYQLELASGQSARKMLQAWQPARTLFTTIDPKAYTLDDTDLKVSCKNPLRTNTPLWLYLMLEALHDNLAANSVFERHKLGRLGGWIVADTLYAAMRSAKTNLENRSIDTSIIWRMLDAKHGKGKYERTLTLKTIVELIYDTKGTVPLKKGDIANEQFDR